MDGRFLLARRLSELAGLVVTGGLAGNDVQPVPRVDLGNERDQRGKLRPPAWSGTHPIQASASQSLPTELTS
jgi:hypothetical protein